jgi:ribosomal protein L21
VIVCAYLFLQIGSHQFKVSNGDSIFTERLKFCDVNDKVRDTLRATKILDYIMMLWV